MEDPSKNNKGKAETGLTGLERRMNRIKNWFH
jgi:hypothetical protein